MGHGRSGKLPIAPLIVLNRFRIIGTGETRNLPISYHSNPFLRKIIVKEMTTAMQKFLIALELDNKQKAIWIFYERE